MLKRKQLVHVSWEDIVDFAGDDWNDDPAAYPTALISSTGWVVFPFKKRMKTLHICRDWDEDGNTPRSVIAIPSGCISSIIGVELGPELWDLSKPDEEPDA